jgi:hypothetical protein|tara:strand:- start:173 stop:346 length:174 start_codon:yes stop_codon:yes gene_type:complete
MTPETIAAGREILLSEMIEQLERDGIVVSTAERARMRDVLTDSVVREMLVVIACWDD